ncbi:uncharacterized protein [Dysidea avara]|uniref:uncharacterized protein n=1 Tax=Dysidea avara TaxID=196820 RepID=UPI0033322C6C
MRSSLLSLFKNKRRRNRPVKQTSTPVLPSSDGGNDEFMVEPAILEAAGPSSAVLPMSIAIESDYQVSYQLNAASSSSSNNNSGNSSISSNNSISSNSSDSSSTTTSSISSNSKGTSTSTNTNSSGSSIDESSECNTYATALSETEVIIESPETSVDWYETAEKETKYKNLREVLSHLLCVRKEEPPPSDAITLIVIAIIIAITIADTLAAVLFYREQF